MKKYEEPRMEVMFLMKEEIVCDSLDPGGSDNDDVVNYPWG